MNDVPANNDTAPSNQTSEDAVWLKLAKDANTRATNYFDNNFRRRMEDDLRMFNSRHPRDSKYNSESYRYRSRVFRPKSRSVLRKNEATAALAFFSNPDVTSIDPTNPDDELQVQSAVVMKELLQYRLTKSIPWFLTVIGGFQDSMNVGLVCSMQVWNYQQKMVKKQQTGFIDGYGEVTIEVEEPEVIVDKPEIKLFPVENILFDPAAHWYDVVETSPYLILKLPMYVNEVLDRMETQDRSGQSWKRYSKETILQARVTGMDALRQARNDNREDPDTQTSDVNEFDVVMVHLNFIKQGHETYAYYTLEDKHLLTEPMLLQEMFPHCKRGRPPVQIGFCVLETHKPVPTSLIGLGAPLQQEANEIANQRLDNVKFVLNKRHYIRRGANVDIESLMRNVPGGATMVNDVERDIREVNWQDVTSSSYQEQDRVNVDFDELLGNFGQGSVLTNRKLNETVGGMRMMAQGSNIVTEYTIRVFVETWVEPVLRDLVLMEQTYETDEVVLAIVAQRAKLWQRFGMDRLMDKLLTQELTLSVNVGMGATDPDTRFQRFMQALAAYNQVAAQGSPDQNLPEIRKELFGLAGFKDSARFFTNVDPNIAKAQKMIAEAQKMLAEAGLKAKEYVLGKQDSLRQRAVALDDRETDLDVRDVRLSAEQELFNIERQATTAVDNIGRAARQQ